MQVFKPVDSLRPFVKAFVIVESQTAMVSRILPGTSVVAAIRLSGDVRFKANDQDLALPRFSISGLRSTYRVAEYATNSTNMLIEFTEGGAATLLNSPMHELFELNLHLDYFFPPSSLSQLHEQLQASVSMHKKVLLVQQFLISKLHSHKTDMLMMNAVEKIKSVNGAISVKQLAQSFHMSLDPFEKRFRKVIGATPKQFGDIIRMKALIERRRNQDLLVNTALEAGFFDQSHFIRTFKKFTGKTPRHFFNSDTGIARID